jgi:hypothetical protein
VECGTTASEAVSSALGVFEYYCSAGKGLVTPKGITASGMMKSAVSRPSHFLMDMTDKEPIQ